MGALAQLMSSQGATMESQIEEKTGEEVLAVGQLKQGKAPSMMAMVTGTALIEVPSADPGPASRSRSAGRTWTATPRPTP